MAFEATAQGDAAAVDFDLDRIGVWVESPAVEVTAAGIAAYAAATGEEDQRLLTGSVAPLMYGVVPSWTLAAQASYDCVPAALRGRAVHGEHDIRGRRPLVPGDRLTSRAAVTSVQPVRTGTVVVVTIESRDASGELVVTQRSTAFYRGTPARRGGGEPRTAGSVPPPASGDPAPVVVTLAVDQDQPARYAPASGDLSPIHLDEAAARAAGLPGVILHGMCSLAIAGRAVVQAVAGGDPTRLRRLACRFTAPVFPGMTLHTEVGGTPGEGRVWFQTRDDSGRQVMVNGLASVVSAARQQEVEG